MQNPSFRRPAALRLAAGLLLAAGVASAQTPRDIAINISATSSTDAPRLTLNWDLRLASKIKYQAIHRRLKGASVWTKLADLTTTQTSHADATAEAGVEYEYWLERVCTNISYGAQDYVRGYLSAGADVPMTEYRGKLLLVIDDTMVSSLAPEIDQLRGDLAGEGWTVRTLVAPRAGAPADVRAQIKAEYDADTNNVRMVYLLGHVPVPYTGSIAPDGHSDHIGAWPCDGYYSALDGTWTDVSVNTTSAADPRNRNVPGDGKFDQSILPGAFMLALGRVDMHGMTRAPDASVSETALLRRYLRRAHDFRMKQGAYAAIPRRSLIRDGFGYFGGESFATLGWSWAFTCVGTDIDEPPADQWFSPDYAGGRDYLMAYGCGGGSWEMGGTVGTTTDFGLRPSRAVFTSLFGSYFGDWGRDNVLLRAPLAGNAAGDSLGLVCFWGGRGTSFMHHMGMGETIGYANWLTQNSAKFGGYKPGGAFVGNVYQTLMGDPALRLYPVAPARDAAASGANGQVRLSWSPAADSDILGYHVFRADVAEGPYARLTPSPVAATTFTDASVAVGSNYFYMVRTLKRERTPGGTFDNLSVGTPVAVAVAAGPDAVPEAPGSLAVRQNGASGALLTWTDTSAVETGFRVERMTGAGGAYAAIGAAPANATNFFDAGPFAAGNVYYYRVAATNAVGASAPSAFAAFEAATGFLDIPLTRFKIRKDAGVAIVTVNRVGGLTGAVSVNYATADVSAFAGAHYLPVGGTLTWADGDAAPKTITVPIIATASPQAAREFKVTLSAPTAGARLTANAYAAVLIEDPTATLAAPWSQTILGGLTDSAPAVTEPDGTVASVTIGGYGPGVSYYSESGQFVYRTLTGDGVLTAYLPIGYPADDAARVALMARASTAGNAVMAAAVGSTHPGNGSRFQSRATAGGLSSLQPAAATPYKLPRWLRLSRSGAVFAAETSDDGAAWTPLGLAELPAMPAAALWGLCHNSSDWSDATLGNYHFAQARNMTLAALPPPSTPAGLAAAPASATACALTWRPSSFASGYRIERRVEGGDFAPVADVAASLTPCFTNAALSANTAYAYRVVATNAAGASAFSAPAFIATAGDLLVRVTTDDAGGADATVRLDLPGTPLGTRTNLDVAWYDPVTYSALTNATKTYLRFNLAGIGTISSATLKLALLGVSEYDSFGYTYQTVGVLADDNADIWDEGGITWSNAPQNDAGGPGFLQPLARLGSYDDFADGQTPPGTVIPFTLYPETLDVNRRDNQLVTLVLFEGDGAHLGWASREHPGLPPPTLELFVKTDIPPRASFLTAAPGTGWSVDLAWRDNSTNETGFALERRTGGGAFETLATLGAGAAAYHDAATSPGVAYAYRVRAFNASGPSDWTPEVSITASAAAVSTVWDGGGADARFSTIANWDFDTAPAADGTRVLAFGAGGTNAALDVAAAARGIVFNRDADFTIAAGGGALTLGDAGIRAAPPSAAPRAYAVAAPVTLAADQTWAVTNNGAGVATLTISGNVSDGGGGFGLAKSGNGLLILAGDNGYGGVTTVRTGGALRVCSPTALGATNGPTIVENGGWLEVSGGVAAAEPLTLNGDAAVGYAGTLRGVGGSNAWTGPITMNGARVTVTSGSLDLLGGVSGTGGAFTADAGAMLRLAARPLDFGGGVFYARGGGTIALAGAGNRWSALDASNGVVRADAPGALPAAAALLLNPGATLDLNGNTQTAGLIQDAGAAAGARLVTSAAPATLTVVQGADTLYSGVFGGALSFVKDGAGTLTLSNAAHATIGAVTVRNGTLALAPGCSFASAASFAVEGGLLALRTAAALPDTATLDISGTGRVRVEAGIEEAVDRLMIDGAEQASGVWGASGSGAEHVDDVHFEGGGRVRVLRSTPATIALQPAPVTAAVGGGASFAVEATGQAPLFYQWYRDGAAIAGATGAVYALTSLTFQDDGAVFSVTVSNALGTASSPGVMLRVTDPTRHSLPYAEPFESYAAGTLLANVGGWRGAADAGTVTDDAALLAALRAYAEPVGLPLRHEAHAKAAAVDGALTNRLLSATGRSVWCDLMVSLTPAEDGLQPPPPDSQCAVAADGQGRLAVWHRDLAGGTNRWSALAWRAAAATAQWARVTLHLDYAVYDAAHDARYFRVFADGVEQSAPAGWSANDGTGIPGGPWFALTAGAQGIGELLFTGNGAVDDLAVSWERPLIGLGPRGTPEWWLADNGLAGGLDLAADELADADADGFANWMEYAAGTGPNDAADLLRFTGAPQDPATGRLTLTVQTVPGRRYGLLSSATLGPSAVWEPEPFSLTPEGPAVETEAAAVSGTLTLYVGGSASNKFYRAIALP